MMPFSLWSAYTLENRALPHGICFLFLLLTCQCTSLDTRKLHLSPQRRLYLTLDLCGYNFEQCCSISRIKCVVHFGELAPCFGKQSEPVIKSVAFLSCLVSPVCPAWHHDIWCDKLFHHLRICFCHTAVRLWFAASGNRTFLEKLL